MRDKLKKYLYEYIILALIVTILFMIYIVKGTLGALAWCFAIFVLGPMGTLLLLINFIVFIISIFRKKKIRIIHIAASIIAAFPVLILMGIIFIPYPDNANISDTAALTVPVEGNAIFLGGKDYHTHAVWPSERYAYDIVEKPYDTGNSDLKSYGIFGKNVYAPVKGEIIEIHDGEKDIEPNVEKFSSLLGNYIYMRIEKTGTYLIFAHLKNNSIKVRTGDIVEVGDVMAQVGNSGTTSEPHLHFQHQKNNPCNSAIKIVDEGLPISFK